MYARIDHFSTLFSPEPLRRLQELVALRDFYHRQGRLAIADTLDWVFRAAAEYEGRVAEWEVNVVALKGASDG